jgi:hypothetical protein
MLAKKYGRRGCIGSWLESRGATVTGTNIAKIGPHLVEKIGDRLKRGEEDMGDVCYPA